MVLLLNTCGAEGVVALAGDEGVRAVEVLPGRGTSERLMPALRRVLTGTAMRDLEAVGVVTGPGSFTSARVGLSAMKGLCEAGAVKMVAMSRLELVARAVEHPYVVALLDAGRGEFYAGLYRADEQVWERLLGKEEVVAAMMLGEAVTCEAGVAEAFKIRLMEEPGAEQMLRLVKERMKARLWSDVPTIDANYLRRTDAEMSAETR